MSSVLGYICVFLVIAAVWSLIASVGIGGKKTVNRGPHRVDRPHVIDPDDYECSVCHRRFRKDQMVCPYCRTRFSGRVTDDEEFLEEEDELEAWDEEDGC